MITWKDEQLIGEPLYNLLDGNSNDGNNNVQEIFRGVRFALANTVTVHGTPLSARNMQGLLQFTNMPLQRIFCYDGADVPTVPVPQAAGENRNNLRRGVILALCTADSEITAHGTLYLLTAAGSISHVLTNPVRYKVEQDCTVLCQVGHEAYGNISYDEGVLTNGN